MGYPIRICRFDSASDLVGKKRTYEAVKARVLEAGRYSIFEATENAKNIALFTSLKNDPELIVDHEAYGYPWIGVRKRQKWEGQAQ